MGGTAHRRQRRRGRRTADLLDLLAVALLVPLLGGAFAAGATRTLPVGTATWAAVAAPAGEAPTGGPLALSWSTGGPRAEALADVVATGTLGTATLALRLEADDPADADAVAVTACVGATWDGPTCGGAPLALGDLATTTTVALALAPGERLALRIEAPRSVANRTGFVLRVEVPRAAARGGAVSAG